jgi:cytidyltransferase-like protein
VKVFCIGVFDLFHFGHLRLIERAAALGELHVAVVADAAIRVTKGDDRPIIPQEQRLAIVQAIRGVTRSFLVPEFAITEEMVRDHDIIVIGEDQNHVLNQNLIPAAKLHRLPRSQGVSTSDIVRRIKGDTK